MRINTGTTTSSITTTTTFTAPVPVVTCGGSGGYTVTIADPRGFGGIIQTFYNSSSGIVTLSTPSGNLTGPGTSNSSTFPMPAGSAASFLSDGANYVIASNAGGVTVASTGTFNSTVTASPSNAAVTLSPSGTGSVAIAPATTGSLDNTIIGASTAAAGTFTNLTVNTATSGAGFAGLYATPGPVGSTTPGAGTFTAFTATGTSTFQQMAETMVTVSSPGSGTTQSYTTGDVYYITAMSANFIFNLTNVPTTTNRNITVTLYLAQGSNPYYCSAFQIDGVGQTIRWPGGNSSPTRVASRVDIQTFDLVRTSSGSWVVTSIFTSYSESMVTSGLVGFWDAGNTASYSGSGTTWYDISGLGQNATLYSGAGFSNGAITFNGSTQYAEVAHTAALAPASGSITVSVWWYGTQTGAGYSNCIINKENEYEISAGGGIISEAFRPNWAWVGDHSYSLNTWYNTVVTYNQSTQVMYTNNVQKYSNSLSGAIGNAYSNTLRFAARNGTTSAGAGNPTSNWAGNLAIVRIWDRGLSQTEVTQEWNAFRGRFGI
jgi:Concanavalin A-like lectin/glucanases superfamily